MPMQTLTAFAMTSTHVSEHSTRVECAMDQGPFTSVGARTSLKVIATAKETSSTCVGHAEVLVKMWTVTDFATMTTAAQTSMRAISRRFQPLSVTIALVQREVARLWVWSWRLTKMDSLGG